MPPDPGALAPIDRMAAGWPVWRIVLLVYPQAAAVLAALAPDPAEKSDPVLCADS